jgi:molybdopterin-guanine dinucleotide biosynthesis protein A
MDGYILAGGLSRRMGRNKAGLPLGDRTFLEIAAGALSAVADPVTVVGDLRGVTTDLPVIPDETGGSATRGAIVGLLTAVRHAKTEWTAVLACDLPFVTADLIRRLAGIAETSPTAACVVPLQSDGRIQPLCGIYRSKECLATLEDMFQSGDWRLQEMFARMNSRLVLFNQIEDLTGSENFFFNVNTEQDLLAAVKLSA